ncbi:MAG: NUDIX hydrolase [Deltaproteobacteria bacterium]|nr:NUDIX hydrolase [Deltaproteobacteria bacterium]
MHVNQLQVIQYPNQPQTPNDQTQWVKWFHHLVKNMPPKGDTWPWGYIHVRPAVAIVALDESKKVVLVSQFRYPFGAEVIEIPKGFVKDGEAPLDAAKREFKEEVRRVANQWQSLGEIIAAPGIGKIVHHAFLAQELQELPPNKDAPALDDIEEPQEQLQVKWVSLDDFFDSVIQDVVIDAVTIAAIEKAKLYLRRANP